MIEKAKELGITVAADANFRSSLFKSDADMLANFDDVIRKCDILKLSDDEARLVTGCESTKAALESLAENFKGALLAVTAGAEGSYEVWRGKTIFIPSTAKLVPVDTTGAGDAFFGTMLAGIDLARGVQNITDDKIIEIFAAANLAGAKATQYLGAI